jgi:N-acetylglucosamine malate deacetylase 1
MREAQRILVIAPHPDDEVLGCGGTIAQHAARGADVHVLVVFDGAAGDPDERFISFDYVGRRQREARAGGRALGVSDYTFWGFPEGHLATEEEIDAGAERLSEFIAEFQPEVVLAPWAGDEQLDHQAVSAAVSRVLDKVTSDDAAPEFETWGFEVWSRLQPDHQIDVSDVWKSKVEAIEQHKTQLAYRDLLGQMRGLAETGGAGPCERFQRWESAA